MPTVGLDVGACFVETNGVDSVINSARDDLTTN